MILPNFHSIRDHLHKKGKIRRYYCNPYAIDDPYPRKDQLHDKEKDKQDHSEKEVRLK